MFGARIATCAVAAAVMLTAGCGGHSPPQQKARLRKAAGVAVFRIRCSQDLWDRTGGQAGINAKVTKGNDGLVTVDLSGPQLVDLLESLDWAAHVHLGEEADPLAARMYDAIAPRVDAIQPTPRAGEPIPEVVIDDAAPAPTPTK